MLELDASGLGCEAPVGLGVVLVAVFDPGGDLAFEGLLIWNAAIEALAGEDRQFWGFPQIEPRPMLGCVHPLKALDEAASFRCWEGLVERRLGVDVQVVLKQRDQVGVREVVVGDLLENVGIIFWVCRSVTLTCRQPSRGANIMKRLATPLRWYS